MLKKIILLIFLISFLSCLENNLPANCLRTLPINLTTDLNNPQLINVQTPSGFVELTGGVKGILLLNINGSEFVAFDRICPQNNCNTAMTFEKGLVLKCACHKSEYSVHFGGAPQTEGFLCPAIQYKVSKSGSAIRISNF